MTKTLTATIGHKLYALAEVKAVDDGSEFGAFEAVLSAPVEDRDGEVIDGGAFNPLPASIPILADHDGQVRSLVARAVPVYEGDVLKAKGRFASHEFAQYVRSLIVEGILDTMSVGFMNPARTVKAGKPHITSGELLEASFVVIPSNREAMVETAKGMANKVYVNIGPPAGSYEDVIANLRAAIASVQEDYSYVSIVGTFADRVVFQVESWMDGTASTYECGYELDDDAAVTLAEMREVELEQVVSPKTFARWAAKAGRRNSTTDQTNLQAAHDAIVKAGAECETKDEGDDTGKSLDATTLETDMLLIELDLDEAEADA